MKTNHKEFEKIKKQLINSTEMLCKVLSDNTSDQDFITVRSLYYKVNYALWMAKNVRKKATQLKQKKADMRVIVLPVAVNY